MLIEGYSAGDFCFRYVTTYRFKAQFDFGPIVPLYLDVKYDMLRLGTQRFEIICEDECSYCRSGETLKDRFYAQLWLQRFKGDSLSMSALRRMLARERSPAWSLDK